jgi:hypothetical protein
MRRVNRRDAVEPAIVEALRKAGAYVALVSQAGLPDLFVQHRDGWAERAYLWIQRQSQLKPMDLETHWLLFNKPPPRRWTALECKTGKGRSAPWQKAQRKFLELTATPVVRTPHAALRAIGCEASSPPPLQLTPTPATLRQEYPRSGRLRRAALLTQADLRRLAADRSSPTLGPFRRIVPDDEL